MRWRLARRLALGALPLLFAAGYGLRAHLPPPPRPCAPAAEVPGAALCEDFEADAFLRDWSVGSRGGRWPASQFVVCGEGFGFGDRCAAWSNHLLFDGAWGFWGYDARRLFLPQDELFIRWYLYVSDPFEWGTLEDKAVMLHDADETLVAYVGSNRNHLPVEKNSGPGMPFVANYQDVDWPETGGEYTRVNRFQNQARNLTLQPGRWYLFEWYIKLNTPGLSDGVTRLWIDDAAAPADGQTLRLEHTDMRWLRARDRGKRFGLLRLTVYHQRCDGLPRTCPPDGPGLLAQSQRWDHIVVAPARIGPLNGGGAPAGPLPPATGAVPR
jgi:hypothetical protein